MDVAVSGSMFMAKGNDETELRLERSGTEKDNSSK